MKFMTLVAATTLMAAMTACSDTGIVETGTETAPEVIELAQVSETETAEVETVAVEGGTVVEGLVETVEGEVETAEPEMVELEVSEEEMMDETFEEGEPEAEIE